MLMVLGFGVLGLIIGSFLNVVILRHGAASIDGRSICMSCGTQLYWYDMVPVFSWIVLRGRCRMCKSRISIQYPLVESATAILCAVIGAALAPAIALDTESLLMSSLLVVCSIAIAAVLIAITTYDIQHTIIPDWWAYTFAALALCANLLMVPTSFSNSADIVLYVIAGPLAALPLFLLWLYSRGAWMGLGDAKLALGIGWLLGIPLGLYAVLLAFIVGAFVSVCILMPLPYLLAGVGITSFRNVHRGLTMKSEVAFGPYLIASTLILWIAMMYGIAIPFIA